MKLAFLIDPLVSLKAYKDSSVAMMRAAQARGHEVWVFERKHLSWQSEGVGTARRSGVHALATQIEVGADDHEWFSPRTSKLCDLCEFEVVFMRQDPPFDAEYLSATWLLERAEQAGVRVVNAPRAVRDHSEKISITEFPALIPATLVSRDATQLQAFIDTHYDTVLKPLDGMGGSRIFRVRADDPNRNVIIETLTRDGAETIMAQGYLPAISEGDKRILIINGEPMPYSLARIPKPGESRGNLAVGGRGVVQALSASDWQIANQLGPLLAARGLLIVGIDVIGNRLTEINVTSPTCFVEISRESGVDIAGKVLDAVERDVIKQGAVERG